MQTRIIGGLALKKKIAIALITVVILGISSFGAWSYFRPVDSSTFEGFVVTLRRSGFTVRDVTEQSKKEISTNQFLGNYVKAYDNQRTLDVNGETVNVITAKADTIDSILKDYTALFTAPNIDYLYKPRLYHKGYFVVTYAGGNERLIKTLDELLEVAIIDYGY